MRLRRLIEILDSHDAARTVLLVSRYDDGRVQKTHWDWGWESYRGYYDQVALLPTMRESSATVGGLLATLKELPGKAMTGYKGGDYIVDDRKPIWVAPYGDTVSYPVLSVERHANEIWLVSPASIERYWG